MARQLGTSNNDTLAGGATADELVGLGGDDLLDGRGGADTLRGGSGRDTLLGGPGNDQLDGGTLADSLTGGAGDDSYAVDVAGDTLLEFAGGGTDRVLASISFTLGANLEALLLQGSARNGTGNAQANILLGNDVANLLRGMAGVDRIGGGAGNDTLDGGSGRDFLDGGVGDDTYFVDDARDVVNESRAAAAGGIDQVVARLSWRLAPFQEDLALVGTGNFSGIGNAQDNVILGNTGDNTLSGGFGVDTLLGGRGDDTYLLDTYGDSVLEQADPAVGGTDLVVAAFSYALGAGEDDLWLAGERPLDGEGNALANRITGQAGNNTLRGYAGNDTLAGLAGKDLLAGGAGHDELSGGDGADLFLLDGTGASADLLTDFAAGTDRIALLDEAFALPLGPLAAGRFRAGAGASAGADADDRIVYDTDTGRLYFDADGAGGKASVPIAQFAGAPALSAAQFFVTDLRGFEAGPVDTVESGVSVTLPERLFNADLTLTGNAVEGGGNDYENAIRGNDADNLLRGYGGGDSLGGGAGDDTLDGGGGNDRLLGGAGSDAFVLSYPGDNDLVFDFVAGTDRIALNTRVFRGLDAGAAALDAAQFHSADGARAAPTATVRIVYDSASGALYYDADGASGTPDDLPSVQIAQFGNDTHPVLSIGDFRLDNQPLASFETTRVSGSVVLAAGDRFRNVKLEGTDNADATGNEDDNELGGNAGNNRLLGESGNDTLIGYEGDDTFDGGAGDDTYYVDDDGDVVEEADATAALLPAGARPRPDGAGGGIDQVIAQVSYTLRANIENLQLDGNDDLAGSGNDLDNLITGNGGDNLLSGAGGKDVIDGATGNDTLDGGSGGDALGGGDGTDSVAGGTGNDTLAGGAGNDTLAGGSGNDTLSGEKGTDRFGFDTTLSASNVDTLTDFTGGSEKLQLDDDVFTAFDATAASTLGSTQFLSGAGVSAANTAEQRILYDTTTGALYYDADGTGATPPVQFALLGTGTHPALVAGDFVIVG